MTGQTYNNRRHYWKQRGIKDIEKAQELWDNRLETGCYICGTTAGKLCIDHDHNTGEPRGILCDTHNRALGLFGDNPELLRRGLYYLTGEAD